MPSSDPRYLIFLALVAALLPFISAGRPRLALLSAVSVAFYMGFNPWYGALLAAVGTLSFAGGRLIDRLEPGNPKSWTFVVAIVATLVPLLDYKYFGAIAQVIAGLESGKSAPLQHVVLPIGISFYTFQAVGYLIDVFVGNVRAERSFIRFAAFITFFPQLTAGPIERARHLFPQLDHVGQFDFQRVVSGLRTILLGLFLKIVIADRLAPIVDRVYESPHEFKAFDLALATLYFSFQVYADFAGYSFIAIGSGRLLGVELLPNFAQPYLSQNLPEFWRTWHMTLSSWFRDYMFTPLQFQWRRFGNAGLVAALIITFIVVGVWHGSGWKFALFGLIHGVLVSYSTLTFKARDRMWRRLGVPGSVTVVCRTAATFLVVTLTFVIFRANTVQEGFDIFRTMAVGPFGPSTLPTWPFGFVAMLIAGDIVARGGWWRPDNMSARWRWAIYHLASTSVLVTLFLTLLEGSSHVRQFIYFKF